MPLGPDVLGYTDLTLLDKSAEELLADALTRLAELQPGYVPRTADLPVALLEVGSLLNAESIFALNRIPGVVVEGLFAGYGVARSPGAQALGTAVVTMGDSLGHLIPAGTRFAVTVAGADYSLVAAAALTIPAGQTQGILALRASVLGTAVNGVPVGTRLTIVDQLPYLDSAVLNVALAGGADVETDAELAARVLARTRRLNDALVLEEHFRLAALDVTGVARAKAFRLLDPARPGVTAYGHVTTAVIGPSGALVPAETKAALAASLTARAVAGSSQHVIDATITTVDVTLTVQPFPGAVTTDVQAAVTAALRSYLSTDTWGWGGTVWRNQLIAVADTATGVDRVVSIDSPATDIALTGTAPLAKAGTITVNTIPAAS